MKKAISINIDSEKLTALEMYLGQKNTKLTDELLKHTDQLYQKYVPSNVRDFIELTATKRGSGKGKKSVNDANRDFPNNADKTAIEP